VALGKGSTPDEIVGGMHTVAEGVRTSKSTVALAHRLGVEMPIAVEVYSILYEGKDPLDAINALMDRELTEE
jgi:glycerol-3-phosphate dehydrogenase (NAD(P)+)